MSMQYIYSEKEAQADESAPVKDGEYEACVEKIGEKTTPNGKRSISLWLRIRDDVEQEERGRVVFDDIWREKDSPEYYNRKRVCALLGTQRPKEGTVFADASEVMAFMQGAFLRIKVRTSEEEYNGKRAMRTRVVAYMPPKSPAQRLSEPVDGGLGSIDINDEDLPF